jgi:hypothetical protein
MFAVLKKEHTSLNQQAISLNEDGIMIATWCKRLHDACPNVPLSAAHRQEYAELIAAIDAYGVRVEAYYKRTKSVIILSEKFERESQSNDKLRLEYMAVLGITTDVTRWHNNTKKLIANIESERELAKRKLAA